MSDQQLLTYQSDVQKESCEQDAEAFQNKESSQWKSEGLTEDIPITIWAIKLKRKSVC